jgi:hypothetical protein
MKVAVEVYESKMAFLRGSGPVTAYTMDHNDVSERRVLGEQCRNAFEGGQVVVTMPAG